jgi:hypothetical protein
MQSLSVDVAGVQAMAGRWGASAGELNVTAAPTGLGMSYQASAAAVAAAHAEVGAFTAALAARVGTHVVHVSEADARYVANEAGAANEMAALAPRVIGV